MIKNQAGQVINAQMINATTGAPFGGAVAVNVTIDSGAQAGGTGTVTAKGSGQYQYAPTQSETNGDLIAFQFTGSGAIDQVINVATLSAGQAAAITAASAPGALTVTDLFTLVLKRINVIQAGGTIDADDAADALVYANLWIDSLATDRLTIPYMQRVTWPLTSTKGTLANPYTVGAGGDVNVTRPPIPNDVVIRYQNTAVTPTLELPLSRLTEASWQAVPQKDLTATLPTSAYYQPSYAGNLGSLYLWMVPTQSQLQGVMYAPAALSQFSSLTQVLVLPQGYQHFMLENLAVMFASTFRENLPVDPGLKQSAKDAKEAIQAVNVVVDDLAVDKGVLPTRLGWYSIYSDQWQ